MIQCCVCFVSEVIPSKVTAKFSIRLVPDQAPPCERAQPPPSLFDFGFGKAPSRGIQLSTGVGGWCGFAGAGYHRGDGGGALREGLCGARDTERDPGLDGARGYGLWGGAFG